MLEIMINSEVVQIERASADTMLLTYLREQQQMTGSKEGCGSGDCGACTVVLVSLDNQEELTFHQINSCITPLHALHGKQIITVEFLNQQGSLHPIQERLVAAHGSQCGFCTPGFMMSLYALSKQTQLTSEPVDYLAGNLCRCTGYGPIIDVANSLAQKPVIDPLAAHFGNTIHWMKQVKPLTSDSYYLPKTRSELSRVRKAHPKAKLIAGGTDLSLVVTQQWQPLESLIDVSQVDDLTTISESSQGWRIGASVSLHDVHQWLKIHLPSAQELFHRIGSMSIRHRATMGGSLGHASPIGDIAPLLLSLDASIELDDGDIKQTIAAQDFFVGYRQTVLKPSQWISAVVLPKLQRNDKHAVYKVSKRFEDDISTVCVAIKVRFDEQGQISQCAIGAGGIADRPIRLSAVEQVLLGQPFTSNALSQAQQAITQTIHPLTDVRGSAQYRILLVQNLLQRFYLDLQQIPTRLVHHA